VESDSGAEGLFVVSGDAVAAAMGEEVRQGHRGDGGL